MPQFTDRKNLSPFRFAKENHDHYLDFYLEVKKGNIEGHEIVHKFGHNPVIDTATDPEDVWGSGGLATWETADYVCTVVSSDAADDGNPIGNGALEIMIEGLDDDFNVLNELLTLEGVGTATTTGLFRRINRAYVTQVGTYHGSNTGTITGQLNSNDYFTIEAGEGQTEKAIYTVPAGVRAYLLGADVVISVGAGKTASVKFQQYQNADDITDPFTGAERTVLSFEEVQNEVRFKPQAPLGPFPGKTDLWWTVSEVGANATSVDVDFELLLIDNNS